MLPDWEIAVRLFVAAGLGSLIGFERERLLWAAGIRTHMLVCVGACLIMIVSAYGFQGVLNEHVVLDPSRVAAQVVSGIGFLGAGVHSVARVGCSWPHDRSKHLDRCGYRVGNRRRTLFRRRCLDIDYSSHPRRGEAS